MQDVADLAKVSKSTVSLAFRDSKRLSEDTVRSVMDVAKELGYAQDPTARMFRTRRTVSLGMLLPQQLDKVLENPYYTMFLRGVGQICQREGDTLLLVPPLRGSIIMAIPYAAVDGFIVSGLETDRGEVTALTQRGIPFVLVDSDPIAGVSSIDLESEGISLLEVSCTRAGGGRRSAPCGRPPPVRRRWSPSATSSRWGSSTPPGRPVSACPPSCL
jgi:DNA-binding LacI/PurR family transcriptional regulator